MHAAFCDALHCIIMLLLMLYLVIVLFLVSKSIQDFGNRNKVHQIKFACAGVSIVRNAVLQLMMCCCIPEILAIKSQSCPKSHLNFYVFWSPNFAAGRGHPNFWPNFINLDHLRTSGKVWWRLANWLRGLGGEKRSKRHTDLVACFSGLLINWQTARWICSSH